MKYRFSMKSFFSEHRRVSNWQKGFTVADVIDGTKDIQGEKQKNNLSSNSAPRNLEPNSSDSLEKSELKFKIKGLYNAAHSKSADKWEYLLGEVSKYLNGVNKKVPMSTENAQKIMFLFTHNNIMNAHKDIQTDEVEGGKIAEKILLTLERKRSKNISEKNNIERINKNYILPANTLSTKALQGYLEGLDIPEKNKKFLKAALADHFNIEKRPEYWKRIQRSEFKNGNDTPTCAAAISVWGKAAGMNDKIVWAKSFKNGREKTTIPIPGDLVIYDRGKKGHVGIFMGYSQNGRALVYSENVNFPNDYLGPVVHEINGYSEFTNPKFYKL